MLVTQQPVFQKFWYPVVPINLLEAGPQPFTLLGQAIVLWLTEEGTPAAVRDRCCHRTAQLSLVVCQQIVEGYNRKRRSALLYIHYGQEIHR